MQLTSVELTTLCAKHITELSDDELNSLSREFNLRTSNIKRTFNSISFDVRNNGKKLCVEGNLGACCSIGPNRKSNGGFSNMISWGGCRNFIECIKICIHMYWQEIELPLDSKTQQKIELIYGDGKEKN